MFTNKFREAGFVSVPCPATSGAHATKRTIGRHIIMWSLGNARRIEAAGLE
jgi:hypothetical protein